MKSLEEVLGLIESTDIKEYVVSLIQAETERGKTTYNKKDQEVLKYKSYIKDLGYDKDKFESVPDFVESLKVVEGKATTATLTIAELTDKVNTMTNELEASKQATLAKAEESRVNKLTATLTQKIGDEFIGSAYMIKTLIADGEVDMVNDNIVFKDNETVIPWDTGYEQLKEQNKGMLKSPQVGGGGDAGGESPQIQTATLMDKIKSHTNLK